MLELHKGLNQHSVCVEHESAVVSMLLNFSIIVKTSTTFTLEWTDLVLASSVHINILLIYAHISCHASVRMVTIAPLIIILKLIIVIRLLLDRLSARWAKLYKPSWGARVGVVWGDGGKVR